MQITQTHMYPRAVTKTAAVVCAYIDHHTHAGKLSPSDFVRVTSTAAAQHFGLYPAKGVIAEGADADVIVLDPSVTHTLSAAGHHSRMDTNIYEGYRVGGKVRCGCTTRGALCKLCLHR